jgi:hypothetical protein
MKIKNVLFESFESDDVKLNDLLPIHVFVLKKMYDGALDLSVAKESTLDAFDDLVAYGLATPDEELTPRGVNMAKYAKEYGSADSRAFKARGRVPRNVQATQGGPRERDGARRRNDAMLGLS